MHKKLDLCQVSMKLFSKSIENQNIFYSTKVTRDTPN
jgi:hypothetical protein